MDKSTQLTFTQFARKCNIARETVYQMVRDKSIKICFNKEGKKRIDVEENDHIVKYLITKKQLHDNASKAN